MGIPFFLYLQLFILLLDFSQKLNIFRLNKSGGFNVPYGNYKNPKIVDEEHLKKISELIKDVEFICCDFENTTNIQDDDFVYMDPPYVPEKKCGFVSYSKDGFTEKRLSLG